MDGSTDEPLDVEIPLLESAWRRWGRRVFGVILLLTGLVPAYFSGGMIYGALTSDEPAIVWLALIPGLLAVLLIALGVRGIRLGFAKPARIRLRESALEIFHPDHMTATAAIPRSSVKGVRIDPTPWSTPIFGHTRRFPLPGNNAWMFSYREGSLLPVIGSTYQIPNLLVALNEPFLFESAREQKEGVSEAWQRSVIPGIHLAPTWDVSRLSPKDPTLGFMATVADPYVASAHLQTWLAASASAAGPGPDRDWLTSVVHTALDLRRRRRRFWMAVGAAAVVIGLVMERLVN
ncbi:MAG: hypothetical protein M3N53_10525 [Actinomycetota bacterium]|nr:hypothetical protein [Actinomycetota bacterium]